MHAQQAASRCIVQQREAGGLADIVVVAAILKV